LTPKTIFDVGVADGTPWLYDTFPQAHFFLFDPTAQSLPYMNSVAERLKANVFNLALGDKSGNDRTQYMGEGFRFQYFR
jgi:hypothetical protein